MAMIPMSYMKDRLNEEVNKAAEAKKDKRTPQEKALATTLSSVEQAGKGLEKYNLGDLGRVKQDESTVSAREGVLARLLEESKGLSSKEMGAARSQFSQRIGRATQQAQRQLMAQQARQGVRGGTAVAQQSGILQAGIQARSEAEAGLIQADRAARLQGLQLAAGEARNIQQDSLATQQINLQQAMREKMAELTSALGLANIAETNRLGEQAIIARANTPANDDDGGLLGLGIAGL